MISGLGGAESNALMQLRQQQALREATQADLRAEKLRADANTLRDEARQASRQASSLDTEADRFKSEADLTRLNNRAAEGFRQAGESISTLRPQASSATESSASQTPPSPASAGGSVNALGEVTGTTISVVA